MYTYSELISKIEKSFEVDTKHLLSEPRKFCIEYKNILSWVDKLGEFHLGGEMVSSSGVE